MVPSKVGRDAVNGPGLHNLLRRVGRLVLAVDVAAGVMTGLALITAAVVLCLLLDAALSLPAGGLLTLDTMLAVVACASLCLIGRGVVRNRYDPRRVAVMIERRLDVADSRLINAVDLCDRPTAGASEQLQSMAVRLGEELAATVRPWSLVDRSRLKRAGLLACLAVLPAVLFYLSAPGVFCAVIPRLMQPRADLPPFTRVRFDVRIEPAKVMFGRRAAIRATLSGGSVPDAADVVFVDGKRRSAPLPMKPQSGEASSFVLELPRAVRSQSFYVDTPAGRSGRYELVVHQTPLFEHVRVEYEYPTYTGLPPVERALGADGIVAPTGTTVTITVTSNVPLERGDLTVPAGEVELKVDESEPRCVAGSFKLTADGEYEMSLVGSDGSAADHTLRGSVGCIPDEPPDVYFTEPAPRVVAAEGSAVEVGLVAADDVAVEHVVLRRSVNEGEASPLSLAVVGSGTTRATGVCAFDLEAMGVRDGDVITYLAKAYDNRPGGGQSADTPAYTIEVVSNERYAEHLRAAEQAASDLVELRQRLASLRQARLSRVDEMARLRQQESTDERRRRLEQMESELAEADGEAAELASEISRLAERGPARAYDEAPVTPVAAANWVEVFSGGGRGPESTVAGLGDVPIRWRGLAAAYFKRLAEDAEQTR